MRRLLMTCIALLVCWGCSSDTKPALDRRSEPPPLTPTQGVMRVIYVADTVDRFALPGGATIAPGVQTNLRKTTAFFADAAQRLGLSYEAIEIRSELRPGEPDHFDCANVMQVVDRAARNPADVIVFYYAGHGENRLNPEGRAVATVLGPDGRPISQRVAAETPYMACTGADARPNLLNVSERLRTADPRLLVVMFDSCNSLGEYEPFSTPAAAPPPVRTLVDERLKELFLRHEGVVHITGSKPGQYSFYSAGGGIATNQLLDAVLNSDPATPLTWQQVSSAFHEVRVTTYRPGTRQRRNYWQKPNMPLAELKKL